LRDHEKELVALVQLMADHEANARRIDADRGLEENEFSYLKADQREVEEEINRKSGAEYMKLLAELEEAKGGIKVAEQTIQRLQVDRESNLAEQNRAFADLKRAETYVAECTTKIRTLGVDRANSRWRWPPSVPRWRNLTKRYASRVKTLNLPETSFFP